MRRSDDWLGGLFGVVTVLPILASAFFGVLVVVAQCLSWLKTAMWETPTLRDGLQWFAGRQAAIEPFSSGAKGFDQIINWGFTTPLAIWLIFVLPLVWLGLWMLVFSLLLRLFSPLPPRKQ